jgi:hypothetical protein
MLDTIEPSSVLCFQSEIFLNVESGSIKVKKSSSLYLLSTCYSGQNVARNSEVISVCRNMLVQLPMELMGQNF